MDDTIMACAALDFDLPHLADANMQTAIEENPQNAVHTPGPGGKHTRLGIFVRKMWANGKVLRVRFMKDRGSGTEAMRAKVRQTAVLWEQYANVYFDWVEDGDAEIRVAFIMNGGNWSQIGTNALNIAQDTHTMNFGSSGWWQPGHEAAFTRTIWHEFGHSIGLVHEHMQPYHTIEWNLPMVYEYYARAYKMDYAMVDEQVLSRYQESEVVATPFDAASIMIYPVDPAMTLNGTFVEWPFQLSSRDIEQIGKMYPKTLPTPAAPPVRSGDLDAGIFHPLSDPSSPPVMNHRWVVNFSTRPELPIECIAGLSFLDIANSHDLRIDAMVEGVLPSQVIVNLQSAGDAVQHGAGFSWFAYSTAKERDIRSGTFTTRDVDASKRFVFDGEYTQAPTVLVFFTALHVEKGVYLCVTARAAEVTTRGFKLDIKAWGDTVVKEATAAWIALPANKPGTAAGRFQIADIRGVDVAQAENQGVVTFGTDSAFTKPPKVFVALAMINMVRGKGTRIRLNATGVTQTQMEWHADSWDDSQLYAADGVYLAVE